MNSLAMASRAYRLSMQAARIDGVYGAGAYPIPDLPRGLSREPTCPRKKCPVGPDGARSPALRVRAVSSGSVSVMKAGLELM